MSMDHVDSKIPGTPTHVYLLQMDPSINISSNEPALPLHLLNNSLEYGHNQYILPMQTKQKEQEQLEVLIGACQEPAKLIGLLVDENYQDTQNYQDIQNHQDIQNQLSAPNVQPQEPPIEKYCDKELSIEKSRQDLMIPKFNITVTVDHVKSMLNKNNTQTIQNYVHISDRVVPPRALAVLPSVLHLQRGRIIAARRSLPTRVRFGPVQGIRCKISQSEAVELVLNGTSIKKPLFFVKDADNLITHIDISDKDKSNWIGLLPLGDESSANVWLYEENNELYGITTEIIPSRKPLMLGYSKTYANEYGLVGPTKDIETEDHTQKPWWCYECQREMPSANLLKRHMDMYHKDDRPVTRRRYRCRHCSRTFSRLFTLKRHMLLHCSTKIEKKTDEVSTEAEPQINLNTSLCSEDNRIPSDESFQNYSNGLDFSTNLFDTDRMPSLDISGNSRCDNDFNPYAISYSNENALTNDLDFSSKAENSLNSCRNEKQPKPIEQLLVSCSYCNQIIVKKKKRQHVSECPARRFECECKKVFTNKKKLAQHIYTQHSNESTWRNGDNNSASTPAVDTNPPDPPTAYKCEQCQHSFKRRGMLVNHLWRVHNTVSARVPLERRVRHYPCVICPKIYRTAFKRDRHVLLHHPGAEKIRGQAVEGGTKVCEPAMCSACPRQYATRAKLLQHQRQHHPHLAPTPTNKSLPTTKNVPTNKNLLNLKSNNVFSSIL